MAARHLAGDTAKVTTPPPPADIAVSVAEAAARVGLTAATLRTWDRRYGLAPSVRTAGGHRRYNRADLERLQAVSRLIEAGHPAAEAVAACPLFGGGSQPRRNSRPGGGRVIPLPGGSDQQRGVARAAMALDGASITRTLAGLIREHGVVATWDEVIAPVLISVGERWERTGTGVEVEHVLATGVTGALMSTLPDAVTGPRPVLLACVPGEEHVLALLALHSSLLAAGTPSILLGHNVPADAILDSVRRTRPRKVGLWAQTDRRADIQLLKTMPQMRPPVSPVLLGPGWDRRHAGVSQSQSLAEAVAELAYAE